MICFSITCIGNKKISGNVPRGRDGSENKTAEKCVRAVLNRRPTEALDKSSTNRFCAFLLQRTARNAAQIKKPVFNFRLTTGF
ncbi:hypothetical protein CHX27_01780 [Flavobacterium aurantiibacter]|uniref:Uncharacterized protein n=1 Tax=Flavobacterium aurantiibacter TaxID=2023067 RepID=A0A256A7D2_9FLAO|nr:hypothetical protein CHX27_01780 [Flavobacterium aurantiibacter]